jgi:hypothetical protein
MYVSNVDAPNVIKGTLLVLKPEIYTNIIIVGDFSIPLSLINKTSRQK